jgi:hypothetical protein
VPDADGDPPARHPVAGPVGPGRALAAVYAVFALAAGSRAVVQLLLDPGRALLAYGLSAFAAVVYLVGAVAFRRHGARARRIARTACRAELAGVLGVGSLSLLAPDAFPDASVWSGYGSGYGHLPLVLPLLGLWWLRVAARPAVPAPPDRGPAASSARQTRSSA